MANDTPAGDHGWVREQAIALLARREHSQYELRLKLWRRGCDDELVDAVIDELRDEDLLSDARFAEAYVDSRARRGFGPVRIRGELQQRGVNDALAEEAVANVECDWEASAAEQRRRRFGAALPEDGRQRQQQYRYLTNRGFTSDQIRTALGDDADEA
jgi:regulatory protein